MPPIQENDGRSGFSSRIECSTIIFPENSPGLQARRLWEETFSGLENINVSNSAHLFTGVGGGPFLSERSFIRKHDDGSRIPSYLDLRESFGDVPKLLVLAASPLSTEDLLGLISVAREYKEQGVEKIIAQMTALPHERQDHRFFDCNGNIINESLTLKDVVHMLATSSIDGGIIVQPHSLESVKLALDEDFPLLPIDAFSFLVEKAGLRKIENPYVLAPDKGRRNQARILADLLNCPMGSATKTRDRLGNGAPTITIPKDVLDYIFTHHCHVVVIEDEIRSGKTTGELARNLKGLTDKMTFCAEKAIAAGNGKGTAVDQLQDSLPSEIFITDAVLPITDLGPLKGKITVIPIGSELYIQAHYLAKHLAEPHNPRWLHPQETGTLLELDFSEENFN